MQPVCFENFRHFPITSCSHEKRYQALHAFPYCKRQKAGQGLVCLYVIFPHTSISVQWLVICCHSNKKCVTTTFGVKKFNVCLILSFLCLHGIVTYFSVFKLWFTIRVSASSMAPESSILFLPRL